jgi:hypothetical protein
MTKGQREVKRRYMYTALSDYSFCPPGDHYVSVQTRLETPLRRACPMSRDRLQPRHERDDAAAGSRVSGDDSTP